MADFFIGIVLGIAALLIVGLFVTGFSEKTPLSNEQIIEMIQECEKFKSADIEFHTYGYKVVRIDCTMSAVEK